MRVLFLVKKRYNYFQDYGSGYSYCDTLGGLYNSARFVSQMLLGNGIAASVVEVIDNNDIDRQVTAFKPNVAIIEALWVVPSKFEELTKLHPNVKWVVRIHSEVPFISGEGVAIDWISQYVQLPNVYLGVNSDRATRDFRAFIMSRYGDITAFGKVAYLPNWYPLTYGRQRIIDPGVLNIACFGAIRPFKNQLVQAMAAVEYGDRMGELVNFHVNGTRCEQMGGSVLSNLRALFSGSPHTLVEHKWEEHDLFLQTMATMDVSMGVSFTETFNITTADAVATKIPIVVSSEVTWADPNCFAPPTDIPTIVAVLDKVLSSARHDELVQSNIDSLVSYNSDSVQAWFQYLGIK